MHVERFTRRGNTLEGTIVTRTPETRVAKYRMTFGDDGKPTHYEVTTTDGSGKPLTTSGATASLDYVGDSIIRRTLDKGEVHHATDRRTERRVPVAEHSVCRRVVS